MEQLAIAGLPGPPIDLSVILQDGSTIDVKARTART
jgi:hypothetical protein